ncbi:MAG: AAA family ATPase, partial [Caldilineaceae bacterium]|nr:AAA family ATPase [Caldilineaceae bacterium]
RKNLRDILPPLRRQIGDYLLLDDEIIGLNPDAKQICDVTRFNAVLEEGLPTVDTKSLAEIVALYRGEFLEGYTGARISADFELWTLRERERLHQLALMGFSTLCRRQQESGDREAALLTNRQLLKISPWDEAAHRRQMLLLAQSGQRTAALTQFEVARQMLADELDVEPDEQTIALYAQIEAGQILADPPASSTPPPAAAPAPQPVRHNLPRQLTNLIGRADDVEAIQRLLRQENLALLTLVGQGGVGKTRLALAVAQYLRQHAPTNFPDGIWFISLAGIAPGDTAAEQIADAIAQALALSLTGPEPLSRQLVQALTDQQLLLILDNFEHLVTEQAFLLELVQSAQQVKVLATSRAQLHLHAEHLYPVVGLPTPSEPELSEAGVAKPHIVFGNRNKDEEPQPVAVGQYASVQLFLSRVQQRLPEFQLTRQNQWPIGHLCRLLGGVPLGIELAAQLYVEQGAALLTQLIAELEQLDPLEPAAPTQGMAHLQTPAIDLPPRQRSIRAVFDHSWHLLTAAEQELLCHCAIFRGGFTRAAALAIVNGKGGTGADASLLTLVMKSLVRRDSHDRYDLHELIRQYVIDEFQREARRVHTAAERHAAYFTELLAGQEERLLQEPEFHQTLRTEIYNIRAAWRWCVEQTAIAELASCVVCLFIYLRYAGQIHEAVDLATKAISHLHSLANPAQDDLRDRLLGYLYIYAASAGIGAGLVAKSELWLQEAQALGERLADAGLLGQIYATLTIKSSLEMENQRMATYAQKAFQLVNADNSPHLQPVILRTYSIGLMQQGKIEESFQVAKELQQLIQTRNYRCIAAESFFLMSKLYEVQQDWEAARHIAQQGRDHCLAQEIAFGLDNVEGNLIWANLQLGNFAQAHELALGFAQRARRTGKQAELLYALQTLGLAEGGLENGQASERYLLEAVKVAVAINNDIRQIELHQQLGILSLYRTTNDAAHKHFQDALHCAKAINHLPLQLLAQAGLALTDLRQGRAVQARHAVEPLFDVAQSIQFEGSDYNFFWLATHEILAAQQDPRAAAILEQLYHTLQTQAAKIKDRAQRQIFLEGIAAHQKIMELWQER